MKLTFLGTGAGKISQERNVSAILLELNKDKKKFWLFDCGEGTQHQMLKANLSLSKLEKIFITHLHGDHLFGLPGILTTRSLSSHMSPLTLYGPKGIKLFIETVIDLSHSWLTYPLTIIEIDKPGVLFDDDYFVVTCDELHHRIPCYGYRIEEHTSLPNLNITKLREDEIPVQTLATDLKLGKKIQLNDGRVINGCDYWTNIRPGRKLAILGDTIPCDSAINLAQNVDLLIHEATQKHELQDKANERGHSTTIQAATIAKQSNAKKLIITHISPRYRLVDNDSIVNECRTVFTNTDIATDLFQVEIN